MRSFLGMDAGMDVLARPAIGRPTDRTDIGISEPSKGALDRTGLESSIGIGEKDQIPFDRGQHPP